jgi:hypothetical protein
LIISYHASGGRNLQEVNINNYDILSKPKSLIILAHVEYSRNGGGNWTTLTSFNGFQGWHRVILDASVLDNQPNVTLQFHLISDAGVTEDGIYVDDVALSNEPFKCLFGIVPNAPTFSLTR